MRIILYLGKGGVGKTTISAASALRCAQQGKRTLVVSTDIAHSLSDSLDVALSNQPKQIADNLYAQEINVIEEIQEHWGHMQNYVGNLLRRQGMDKAVAEEMAIIPGMEEVVSLLHIHRQAMTGDFDCVVVDAAPTGETMRLLTMPESFQWYVERFTGSGANTTTTTRIAGGLLRRLVTDKDPFQGLTNLVAGVKELQKVLSNRDITSYRVVLNPEKMVLKEAARAITYLSLFNYPVDAAIVNRILPGIAIDDAGGVQIVTPSPDPYLNRLQEIQTRYLTSIGQDFYPLPILQAPWRDQEMVGLEMLSTLADTLFSEHNPDDILFVGQTQRIEEDGDNYVLKLPLPNVELEKVKLSKRGDELFIRIGNFKRELLLPTALAQREAGNAKFDNGVLNIVFPAAD
ncbi:MAG: ArsA family ATPase [Chloroflexota bacterium]